MPFAAPPPPKPAETIVWLAQPSADDIARAGGAFGRTSTRAAKAAMTCYVLADGSLDACRVDELAPDITHQEAILSLKGKYRLNRAASSPATQVTVAVTFPKLVDIDPTPVAQPSPAAMRAALSGAEDVAIPLRCKVTLSGALEACEADAKKESKRFEAAALGLAGQFRFAPLTLNGRPTEGYASVVVSSSSHVIAKPDWVQKPTGDDLAQYYPQVAQASGLGGRARMRCSVNADGALSACQILSEDPPGIGFGDALLKIAPKFRMGPKSLDGKPIGGGEVVIPVTFQVPGHPAKIAPGTPGSFKILPWAPWIEAPAAADVAAAFPKRALAAKAFGNTALRCELKRDGRLNACEVTVGGPDAMGFGDAALGLAKKFRADVSSLKPSELSGFRVAVSVNFSERELKPAAQRFVRQPDWLRAPDAQTVINAYPDKAVKAGVLSGKGVVDCLIDATGMLEGCKTTSEEPEGLDFGLSAVKVASVMQANLWTRDGEAAAGQHVLLPLRFIYSGPLPVDDKATPAPKPGG